MHDLIARLTTQFSFKLQNFSSTPSTFTFVRFLVSFATQDLIIMDSIYSQLDQHQLLFTQVAIQLVAWYHVFEYTKWYLRTHCTTHKVRCD